MRVPGVIPSPFKSRHVIRRPSTCATGQKGDGEWSPGFTKAWRPLLNSMWPSVLHGPMLNLCEESRRSQGFRDTSYTDLSACDAMETHNSTPLSASRTNLILSKY